METLFGLLVANVRGTVLSLQRCNTVCFNRISDTLLSFIWIACTETSFPSAPRNVSRKQKKRKSLRSTVIFSHIVILMSVKWKSRPALKQRSNNYSSDLAHGRERAFKKRTSSVPVCSDSFTVRGFVGIFNLQPWDNHAACLEECCLNFDGWELLHAALAVQKSDVSQGRIPSQALTQGIYY